jgi:hypothetical protein
MKQAIRIATALAVVSAVAGSVRSVDAHHSMVMYDRTRTVTLHGTVVELVWSNPHVFLRVNGRIGDHGPSGIWMLETSGPTNLARLPGWSATALKPGDRVRVEINPLREGEQHNARLTRVTVLDTGLELGTAYQDLDLVRPK